MYDPWGKKQHFWRKCNTKETAINEDRKLDSLRQASCVMHACGASPWFVWAIEEDWQNWLLTCMSSRLESSFSAVVETDLPLLWNNNQSQLFIRGEAPQPIITRLSGSFTNPSQPKISYIFGISCISMFRIYSNTRKCYLGILKLHLLEPPSYPVKYCGFWVSRALESSSIESACVGVPYRAVHIILRKARRGGWFQTWLS